MMPLLRLLLLALAWPCLAEAPQRRGAYLSFRVGFREHQSGGIARRRGLVAGFNATLPLQGSVYEYGYFFANISLGTPPQPFTMIVDSGSSLPYVPCTSCGPACGPNHLSAPFDPAASSTAQLVPCASPQCVCGSGKCGCSSSSQCTFSVGYAEGSSSTGLLVHDVLSVEGIDGGGGSSPLTFGCATAETGYIFSQAADGILALGNSNTSTIGQLAGEGAVANVFSICFGGAEGEGALLLGDAPLPRDLALLYTPMVASPSSPSYYTVGLTGILLGDQLLPADEATYQQGYGALLDSGTTFTYLPSEAFDAFVAEVDAAALAGGLFKVPGPQEGNICYGGAPADPDRLGTIFPPMTLEFAEMEPLTLPPINYLFVRSIGRYCLAVFDNGAAGTVLGGITFRNTLVQYDRANRRVGFAETQCRELGLSA